MDIVLFLMHISMICTLIQHEQYVQRQSVRHENPDRFIAKRGGVLIQCALEASSIVL